jgi:hypothetical protein
MGLKEPECDVEWIQLTRSRVQWRAVANTVKKLRVHERRKI